MTAYEIINRGFALAGESLDMYPDKNLALVWLNITLGESMDAENHIRERQSAKLLALPAQRHNLSDEVEIGHMLATVALPYGVAAYLFSDREDNYMASVYRNRFVASLQDCAKGCETSVTDVYGGGYD
jgi:hypothetical protein